MSAQLYIMSGYFVDGVKYFFVKFIDWNGVILKEGWVEEGTDAVPPPNPIRNGYTFYSWNGDYTNISSDISIYASYEQSAIVASLTTRTVTGIATNSAQSGGIIVPASGSVVTSKGVCWSTSGTPTVLNSKTIDGSGTSSFTSNITGLAQDTLYYVRAYVSNNSGTMYGNTLNFTTSIQTSRTDLYYYATGTTQEAAWINGNNNNWQVRGTLWLGGNGYIYTSEFGNEKITNYGYYIISYVDLTPDDDFHYSYIDSGGGFSLLGVVTFRATLTTTTAYDITTNSAKSGGYITDDGGSTVTARGLCWTTIGTPTIADYTIPSGSGTGSFTSNMAGLTENTTYYIRAYATNSMGTAYGTTKSFTTLQVVSTPPTVVTYDATSITKTSAQLSGETTNQGSATVTESGIVWSLNPNPTTANNKIALSSGLTSFNTILSNLSENTTYYFKAYAISSVSTAYGSEKSFTTLQSPTVVNYDATDITYNSAKLSGQTTNQGTTSVTESGVVWSLNPNPTTSDNKIPLSSGLSTFNVTLSGLNELTTYYYNSYATSSVGTSYGTAKSFNTLEAPSVAATVITNDATNVTYNSAGIGGEVTDEGSEIVTESGVVWSLNPNPTTANNKIALSDGVDKFGTTLTALSAETTYYYNAYAISTVGTSYGTAKSFTTLQAPVSTPPTVTLSEPSNITYTTVYLSGEVTLGGSTAVTERGFCWAESDHPSVGDFKKISDSGVGTFNATITDLSPNTTYFVRAYAINSIGTSYSDEYSFDTIAYSAPILSTVTVSSITYNSATSGGNIISDGGVSITSKGVCWNTTGNPTTGSTKTSNGSGSANYVSYLTSLNASTTYYVKAYATNSVGTAYGSQVQFTTSVAATVITNDATNVTYNSTRIGGEVTDEGSATVTESGVVWALTPNPTTSNNKIALSDGVDKFGTTLTALSAETTYYYNAYAISSVGTSYGTAKSFTTIAYSAPILSTVNVSSITTNSATSGGNIISDGGVSITSKGVCWNTTGNPTTGSTKTSNGSGSSNFITYLTNLNQSTTYYVRAYAINSIGVGYGTTLNFTTLQSSRTEIQYYGFGPTQEAAWNDADSLGFIIIGSIWEEIDGNYYDSLTNGNIVSSGYYIYALGLGYSDSDYKYQS